MFFKRLELKEKIWCDIVAQAKVVRANYGHQLHTVLKIEKGRIESRDQSKSRFELTKFSQEKRKVLVADPNPFIVTDF